MEDSVGLNIDNLDFVKNASIKSKVIGHNKFQLQLIEANGTIDDLNVKLEEKNKELELFKNNLRAFHLQIQEKNTEIAQLKEKLNSTSNSLDVVTRQMNTITLSSDQSQTKHQEDYLLLLSERSNLQNNILQLNKNNSENTDKYNELKVKYQTILELLEDKSKDITELNTLQYNTLNELNLYKDLNSKKQLEIDMVKQELYSLNNENSVMKTRIFDLEDYSKDLTRQYSDYISSKKHSNLIENENVNENETVNETDNETDNETVNETVNAGIKLTHKRGIKISKR